MGHTVMVPHLPGHASSQISFRNITLTSYIQHIENLVRLSQRSVILVGHSMAGFIITQVAENIPDKINRLIYINAFIPQNGGSLIDEEKQALIPSVALDVEVDEPNEAILLTAAPQRIRELFYHNCLDEDVTYALTRLQAQPLKPFLDKVSISEERFGSVPKLYISCLQDKAIMSHDQKRMYSRIVCDVIEMDTDHSPFFSADQELAHLLATTAV